MSDRNERIYRYSCDCGCGDGFELRNAYGRLYVHSFRGDWYSEQHPGRHGLMDRLKYLAGRRLVRDVVMSEEALESLRAFLRTVSFEPGWKPDGPAYAMLSFACEDFPEGDRIRQAYLEGCMPAGGVLLGWYHRLFELDVGPRTVARWIREIDACLA